MIFSTNRNARGGEFEALLDETLVRLSDDASENEQKYLDRSASEFEEDVCNFMRLSAEGGIFENTIDLVGGQKLPDIVANHFYGVEVKTIHTDSWSTTGNSIFEGTRIGSVERIYLLVGKLARPIEFRARPYEDCLSDIKVTHSPRYTIDMELDEGESIFEKIGVPYEVLRQRDNLEMVEPIKEYYRENLNTGEALWWLDTESEGEVPEPTNIAVRLMRFLKEEEQDKIRNQIFVLFPEVLGRTQQKYARAAVWVMVKHSIVSISFRDRFSGGKKVTLAVGGETFTGVPTVFMRLRDNVQNIIGELDNFSLSDFERYWGYHGKRRDEYETMERRIETWIDLISEHSMSTLRYRGLSEMSIEQLIRERL